MVRACVRACACLRVFEYVCVSLNVLLLPLYVISSVCRPITDTDINTGPHGAVFYSYYLLVTLTIITP